MLKWLLKLAPSLTSVLPNPWIIAAFLVLLGGAYFYGYSNGTTGGKAEAQSLCVKEKLALTDQFNIELTAKQGLINQMVAQENTRVRELNSRIADLEAQSRADADRIADLQKRRDTQRSDVVVQYRTKYVEVAKQCGMSPETAATINMLLEVR